jgi:hypothetical protein
MNGLPAQPPPPRDKASFDAEISAALRYEKGLAIKAAAVIALVLVLVIAHIYLFS